MAMADLAAKNPNFKRRPELNGGIHHKAKLNRIYLFMSGGPSHHDTWDYKPKMRDMFGKELPEEIRDGQRITGMTAGQKSLPVCPSKYEFTKYENNQDGVYVSSLLPNTAKAVKEMCIVNSTFTEAINHDPAITYIQTGSQIPNFVFPTAISAAHQHLYSRTQDDADRSSERLLCLKFRSSGRVTPQ